MFRRTSKLNALIGDKSASNLLSETLRIIQNYR